MSTSRLVLASGSKARREILGGLGILFDIVCPDVEESVLMERMTGQSPIDIAMALAQAKALEVSAKNRGAFVIGGDQILVCSGRIYSKAASIDEARRNLLSLRGKTHDLISAVCVARGEKVIWSACDGAHMTMRPFDDVFLDAYMKSAGDALTSAVGAYEIEGQGAVLFEKVEGDQSTIMGMPFAPLKQFLRDQGIVP